MSESTQTGERRAFGRRRSCIHAFVLVPGRPAAPCILRNFSPTGAMLELNERLEPPFNIELCFTANGDRMLCEVRHVRGFSMGVRFLGDGPRAWYEEGLTVVRRSRKRKRKARTADEIVSMGPAPRVTGGELRRRVLKQPL